MGFMSNLARSYLVSPTKHAQKELIAAKYNVHIEEQNSLKLSSLFFDTFWPMEKQDLRLIMLLLLML